MGLILCNSHRVNHPYYIEELDISLYSFEEICYIIYEYPLLVLEDFINKDLIEFIKTELDMGMLAMQIEKMLSENVSDDEILLYILDYGDFYKNSEIAKYRNSLLSFRKLHRAFQLKSKADYVFGLGKYAKANALYAGILKFPRDRVINDNFMAQIYNNLGSTYANLFLFEKAYDAYKKAYELNMQDCIIKNLYYITLMDVSIEFEEVLRAQVNDDLLDTWYNEYMSNLYKIENSSRISDINEIFEKDSIKKNKLISDILGEFKKEYRKMI